MKDIVISGRALCRELWIALVAFLIAYGCNVWAVIHYDRPAIELLSQIGFVTVIAVAFYLLAGMVRLVAWGAWRIVKILKTK